MWLHSDLRHSHVNRKPQATLEGHSSGVTCLAALPDGTLASGSADGTVRLWRDGESVDTLWGHRGTVRCLAVFPDGMLASGSADSNVLLWEDGECVGRCVPDKCR